jgi:tetratricopeptide (TPR) repeat protein
MYQDKAVKVFEYEIRINPCHPFAHLNLGQIYWYEFHKRQEALYHLKTALILGPFLPRTGGRFVGSSTYWGESYNGFFKFLRQLSDHRVLKDLSRRIKAKYTLTMNHERWTGNHNPSLIGSIV